MKNKILSLATYLFSFLLLFNACGEQLAQWDGTVEEIDGIAVVKNPVEPLNSELQIQFQEELSIGLVDGDENYMFGSRILLNTDEEGNFYVTDVDRVIANKYDANGRFLQSIGRPGQGPGEFQAISKVRFDNEGNIYLYDRTSQRLSFLKKDGQFLRGFRPQMYTEEVQINHNGYYIAKSADNVELKGSKKWDYFYGLFDDEFNLVAEFLRQPQEAGAGGKGGSVAQILADYLSSVAFRPEVNYALDKNDVLYFGYSEDYEIKVYSPEGKLLKIIQRDYKPSEIRSRDKDYFKQTQREQLRSKMPIGQERKVFELVEYPKYKPAYERFVLMENGWIFVIVDSTHPESTLVDIFNQEGEYLGQFETDIQTDQLFFKNGKAYVVATIEDYKYVKRYSFKILGLSDNESDP